MIPSYYFSQLVQTLRLANSRIALTALLHRTTLRPTHHAKRTASHLRIDISKARRCPISLVSRRPLPLLDPSPPLVPVADNMQALDVDTMVSSALKGLHYSYPDLLVYSDIPIPGAPLLRPCQLPEVDASELSFDSPKSSSGKSLHICTPLPPPSFSIAALSSCELFTPPEAYTGLRIIIPARNNKKRKWQDAQIGLDDEDTRRAKRIVVNGWITSPIQTHEYIDTVPCLSG
ncbi:hypothetical protein BKA82DRAFT_4193827 [Pisolithus tinctorius]|nr:hypothetical protein BKA82DRAFT_4193827 [Pisolithus tinctorius]